jgi:hypothetical protein
VRQDRRERRIGGRRQRCGARAALGLVPCLAIAVVWAGCTRTVTSVSTTAPTGPVARLSGPVTSGRIAEPASLVAVDLAAHHYVEEEYFASGTATSYSARGALGSDGKWAVTPGQSADYRTRIVVRRPADPRRFNGTLLVEWFNVSGGLEADPDWAYLGEEIVRRGYAYVGVSVQALGIEGGHGIVQAVGSAGGGLRATDPGRYGTLHHPGDQYSYDIFSQVGRALRSPGPVPALGALHPQRLVAVGESQSAIFLTSYIDAVEPVAHVYDGFFVHSRAGGAASIDGRVSASEVPAAVHIRDDLAVPVLVFETETDVGPLLDYGPARQPDTDHFRAWEVAGTAHADAFMVGPVAHLLGCTWTINEGPQHFVVMAALRAMQRWLVHGTPPPGAPPLRLASTDPPVVARDALGNALGGVRTPDVDSPVAALSGDAPSGASLLCSLFGQTTPFDAATLARLYPDHAAYLRAYSGALDKAIAGGFVLSDDRAALVARAEQFQLPAR